MIAKIHIFLQFSHLPPNHWSNLEKCEGLFRVIIFPYFSAKKKELGYQKDQFLKLSDLKPLHARWIVETYNHLKHQNDSIIKGFDAAGISEAITCANDVFTREENPFDEQRQ